MNDVRDAREPNCIPCTRELEYLVETHMTWAEHANSTHTHTVAGKAFEPVQVGGSSPNPDGYPL